MTIRISRWLLVLLGLLLEASEAYTRDSMEVRANGEGESIGTNVEDTEYQREGRELTGDKEPLRQLIGSALQENQELQGVLEKEHDLLQQMDRLSSTSKYSAETIQELQNVVKELATQQRRKDEIRTDTRVVHTMASLQLLGNNTAINTEDIDLVRDWLLRYNLGSLGAYIVPQVTIPESKEICGSRIAVLKNVRGALPRKLTRMAGSSIQGSNLPLYFSLTCSGTLSIYNKDGIELRHVELVSADSSTRKVHLLGLYESRHGYYIFLGTDFGELAMFEMEVVIDGRFIFETTPLDGRRRHKEKHRSLSFKPPTQGVRFFFRCLLYASLTKPQIARQELMSGLYQEDPLHLLYSKVDRVASTVWFEKEGNTITVIVGSSDGAIAVLKQDIKSDQPWRILPWTNLYDEFSNVAPTKEETNLLKQPVVAVRSHKRYILVAIDRRILVFSSVKQLREGDSDCLCFMSNAVVAMEWGLSPSGKDLFALDSLDRLHRFRISTEGNTTESVEYVCRETHSLSFSNTPHQLSLPQGNNTPSLIVLLNNVFVTSSLSLDLVSWENGSLFHRATLPTSGCGVRVSAFANSLKDSMMVFQDKCDGTSVLSDVMLPASFNGSGSNNFMLWMIGSVVIIISVFKLNGEKGGADTGRTARNVNPRTPPTKDELNREEVEKVRAMVEDCNSTESVSQLHEQPPTPQEEKVERTLEELMRRRNRNIEEISTMTKGEISELLGELQTELDNHLEKDEHRTHHGAGQREARTAPQHRQCHRASARAKPENKTSKEVQFDTALTEALRRRHLKKEDLSDMTKKEISKVMGEVDQELGNDTDDVLSAERPLEQYAAHVGTRREVIGHAANHEAYKLSSQTSRHQGDVLPVTEDETLTKTLERVLVQRHRRMEQNVHTIRRTSRGLYGAARRANARDEPYDNQRRHHWHKPAQRQHETNEHNRGERSRQMEDLPTAQEELVDRTLERIMHRRNQRVEDMATMSDSEVSDLMHELQRELDAPME
eukprot:gb/GECG01016336.1/.p1 GENE.gb/GECG01016336.1/~~gb/GECG01016336.1/.p1  ORF type:complete len:1003 (+),score=145.11 gb/GECG01016336.1/:1-3009(+)